MRATLLIAVLLACQPLPGPSPHVWTGGSGGGLELTGGALASGGSTGGAVELGGTGGASDRGPCTRAYQRALLLGCPPAAPTNGTWIEVCELARRHASDMGTTCAESALNCDEVSRCFATPR